MNTTVSRLITSFQSTGRMGRSTLQQALISWFAFAGIEFSSVDADSEHKTLSSWYPDIATSQLTGLHSDSASVTRPAFSARWPFTSCFLVSLHWGCGCSRGNQRLVIAVAIDRGTSMGPQSTAAETI
jgi:hypothetical protein